MGYKKKYYYSKAIYVNTSTKLKVIHPIHGVFESIPRNHTGRKSKLRLYMVVNMLITLLNKLSYLPMKITMFRMMIL